MFDLKKFIAENRVREAIPAWKQGLGNRGPTKVKELTWKVENAVAGVKHYLDLLKREGKRTRNREIERQIHELDIIVARAEDKVKAVLSVIDDEEN